MDNPVLLPLQSLIKEADNNHVYTIQTNILPNRKLISLLMVLFLASAKTDFIAYSKLFIHSLDINIDQFIILTYFTSKLQIIGLSDLNLNMYIWVRNQVFIKKEEYTRASKKNKSSKKTSQKTIGRDSNQTKSKQCHNYKKNLVTDVHKEVSNPTTIRSVCVYGKIII